MAKRVFCFISFLFCFKLSFCQHYILYGITGAGGAKRCGLIYRYDPVSGKYDTLYSLNKTDGSYTWGGLLRANNGLLYGTTFWGGTKNLGVLFSFNPYSKQYKILVNFDSSKGYYEYNGNCLMQAKNGLLYGTRELGGKHNFGTLFSYNITTGWDSILLNFDTLNGHGAFPNRTVVEDTVTGYMYGTTFTGGNKAGYGPGVIYRYDPPTGKDTVLNSFDTTNTSAGFPKGNTFIMTNGGSYYGMTQYGGIYDNLGTIYSFKPDTLTFKTLVKFNYITGMQPTNSNLMQAGNGLCYFLTHAGGKYYQTHDYGTIINYDIDSNKINVLVNFDDTNGNWGTGDLVQDPDNGLLYGVTVYGGKYGYGVLFSYNIITGKENVVVNFNDTNGSAPMREPTLVWDTGGLGIKEVKRRAEVKIYPNPNSGIFTLQSSGISGKSIMEIYNALGEKVYSSELIASNTQINLKNNAPGIYFYRVITETGDLVGEGKFIKE